MAYRRFCPWFKPQLESSCCILIRKSLPSLQLAVGKFMTECFMNHESFASRLHVGPSLDECARVDFS